MEKKKKKANLLGRWLSLLAGLTFLFQACQKESPAIPIKDPLSGNGFEVENKLRDFIQLAHALPSVGQAKSGGAVMTPDEAVWLIEASLNYAYVTTPPSGFIIASDTVTVSMEKSGNAILETAAAQVFLNIFGNLANEAGLLGNIPKALNTLDIDMKPEVSGEINLEVRYSFSEISGPISPFQDFSQEDWWWFGYGMGKCNGLIGWIAKDAATEITTRINATLSQPAGHSFYTDLSVVFITIDAFLPLPPGTDPNFCATPLFYNTNIPPWSSTFHYCLSPAEMNHHYYGTYGLLPAFRPWIDPNDPSLGYKNIVSCIVIPTERINASGFIEISHSVMVFYGISQKASNWEPYYW